ncbi:hypothetical protein PVK06_002707 [Gossypium arboreum]|uniref:Uncharacterized protein n=1 Tax=Gossypium arboreum TaxID=29729 RepID=A0ABR0R4H9_GOSAR|nr:hypothetical protein PVK06_002707 [Gossypium arboreum]
MIVLGLPPIGCLLIQMTAKFEIPTNRKCLEDQNSDAGSYNKKLLPELQEKIPGSKLVYADIYQPLYDMINYPQHYGFAETKRDCCGTGLLEASFLCNPLTPICRDPSKFLFWNSIPAQQAYIYLANCIIDKVYSNM